MSAVKKTKHGGGRHRGAIKTGQRKVKRAETEIQRLLDAYQAGLLELNELQQRTSTVRPRLKMWQNRIPQLEEQKRQQQNQATLFEEMSGFLKRLEKGISELTLDQKQRIESLLLTHSSAK